MRIISRKSLIDFYQRYPDSKRSLEEWFHEVCQARWKTPADVKLVYPSASILKKGRVVFDIRGNRYRLVVKIVYATGAVYVRFIGTHKEYDQTDVEVI
jgi:mRNA interferase HigB